jgi:hypothetical protein
MGGEGEGPGSSSRNGTMNPHGHIAIRLFSTPSVFPQTSSIPYMGDARPPQDMPDFYPGSTHIQSIVTTAISFLVDQDMVPLKIVQLPSI